MSLLGGAGALAVALVLLVSGGAHLRDRAALRAALAAHGVLPAGARRAVTALLGPVEVVLALALLAALVAGPVLVPALAAAVLAAGFTAYLLVVVRRTRGEEEIPCGCGLGTTPVGPWAVVRAALLTGLAGLAVVGGTPGWSAADVRLGGGSDLSAPVWATALLVGAAGLTLAVATAALPAARAVPASLTTLPGGAR
ncbi:MauE/DoxX family redox-associated membrane protein [Ornithinimicrobium flavum]|uniref:MauE/DoxX family redox-associated membrane protein n=1 Tax=Ornithinimicrobium flavum TaxID=1288636 RepID=UPI00106F62D3|nr:MauE/DoxX family redox-associated membrane protein [Ornithinimicrobium flavum]